MLITWCVGGAAYVTYLTLVDVPMYWLRWITDEANGRPYLTVIRGLTDAFGRRVVSYRWEDWHTEIAWMSLYFSVGVWLSISLIHTSTPDRGNPAIRNLATAYRVRRTRLAIPATRPFA
jgi:hypothetical protein